MQHICDIHIPSSLIGSSRNMFGRYLRNLFFFQSSSDIHINMHTGAARGHWRPPNYCQW